MKLIVETEEDYVQGLLLLDVVMLVAKDEEGEPLLPIIDIIADAVMAYEDQLPSVQVFDMSIEEEYGGHQQQGVAMGILKHVQGNPSMTDAESLECSLLVGALDESGSAKGRE